MKLGLLQLNFVVGDVEGNKAKLLRAYRKACAGGAQLTVCSELALYGYPPLDLLERSAYVAEHDRALCDLAQHVGEVGLVLGATQPNPGAGKPLFNAALLVRKGRVEQRWRKALLPSYDVFDETRYFEPGTKRAFCFDYDGTKLAMLLCEDIWGGAEQLNCPQLYGRDPVAELQDERPDVVIVPNGSPYCVGKHEERLLQVAEVAHTLGSCVVYVNQVGGNTDLVFDGGSFVVNERGQMLGCAKAFEQDVAVVDTDALPTHCPTEEDVETLYRALVLGVGDYVRKTGHRSVVVGLSGGLDSSVTACIAAAALEPERVTGMIMPSPFSSEHSVTDAEALVERLGIGCQTVPIERIYRAYDQTLAPVLAWHTPGAVAGDVTEENVQARIRGNVLMAFSNRNAGTLVLSTGNKSELAVGFCTLYGDMAGGFSALSDVWKTQVQALGAWLNRQRETLPPNVLLKPPSAELRPGQRDTDSLPPYDVLDPILKAYLEDGLSTTELQKLGLADERTVAQVLSAVNRNEHKRRQMAPGLKVTSKAFGSGRRVPIAAKFL